MPLKMSDQDYKDFAYMDYADGGRASKEVYERLSGATWRHPIRKV